MQSTRTTVRSVCAAHNAFNPALALRAAFGTTSQRRQQEEEQQQQQQQHVHRGPIRARRTGSTHRGASLQDLDHHEVFKKCVPAMQRHARFQFQKGDALNKEQWPRHMQLVKELSARLATKDGKAALQMLNAKEQHALLRGIDYTPKVIGPQPTDLALAVPPPWSIPMGRRGLIRNGRTALNAELSQFYAYISLSPMERVAREAVAKEIVRFVKKSTSSRTGVELYGSAKTGLASPLSDIDVRVWDTRDLEAEPRRLSRRLERLRHSLYSNPEFGCVHLRHGQFPIINCQHMQSGIQIQIVAGHGGIPQQAVVAKYLESVPALRDTFFVIRTFFEIRGLSDVYNGGINSYGQFVMLLAAIGRTSSRERGKDPTPSDLLLKFLSFYNVLDSTKRGVAVFPRSIFLKHDHHPTLDRFHHAAKRRGDLVRAGQWRICTRQEFEPALLCIQDPATPTNDLGKRSSASKHILLTIQNARYQLKRALENHSTIREDESMLEILVGRCHEIYRSRRAQLEAYGEKVARGQDGDKHAQEVAAVSARRAEAEAAEVEQEDLLGQMEAEMEDVYEEGASKQSEVARE
ncbi:hypothetical protein PRZ48_010560 [Zasmidium cellare]|uniref:Poly(A) RNA polymerase mitochondrial-like central palm domain-containing protein n=1 Tax=Zasmidium cellare TaxID=395010 RepID=A0ABR0E9J3_ZASCE|nr:hypothetical protein PRZ48_010560 [Zasmidium cellare]